MQSPGTQPPNISGWPGPPGPLLPRALVLPGGLGQRGAQPGGDEEEDVGRKAGWTDGEEREGWRPGGSSSSSSRGSGHVPPALRLPRARSRFCAGRIIAGVWGHTAPPPAPELQPEEFAPQPAGVGWSSSEPAGEGFPCLPHSHSSCLTTGNNV